MTRYYRVHFENKAEAKAYAHGLDAGIAFESQPGSDPSRVRVEEANGQTVVWIEPGYYDNDGNVVWRECP